MTFGAQITPDPGQAFLGDHRVRWGLYPGTDATGLGR
jgi:hypothetical protein